MVDLDNADSGFEGVFGEGFSFSRVFTLNVIVVKPRLRPQRKAAAKAAGAWKNLMRIDVEDKNWRTPRSGYSLEPDSDDEDIWSVISVQQIVVPEAEQNQALAIAEEDQHDISLVDTEDSEDDGEFITPDVDKTKTLQRDLLDLAFSHHRERLLHTDTSRVELTGFSNLTPDPARHLVRILALLQLTVSRSNLVHQLQYKI